jgi:rubrerythrin
VASANQDIVQAILETGMEIEKAGIRFYSDAEKAVEDPKGRKTLRFLVKEEKRHLQFLRDLAASLKETKAKGLPTTELFVLPDPPKIFPEKGAYQEKVKASEGDRAILEEAKKVEERSVAYYTDCRERAGEEYREVFSTLVHAEEEHFAWIRYLASALDVHGHWLDLGEEFSLDG